MITVKICYNITVNSIKSLIRTLYVNFINLKTVFIDKEIVYLIYEQVDLALNHLHLYISLKEAHIATICKKVRRNTTLK